MTIKQLNNEIWTIKQGHLNEYYEIRIWVYIGKIKTKTKTVLKNRHGHNKTTQDKPQTQVEEPKLRHQP